VTRSTIDRRVALQVESGAASSERLAALRVIDSTFILQRQPKIAATSAMTAVSMPIYARETTNVTQPPQYLVGGTVAKMTWGMGGAENGWSGEWCNRIVFNRMVFNRMVFGPMVRLAYLPTDC
jgi:hypothetical protein